MDRQLLKRRASLLDRHDTATERWAQRTGAAFQKELTEVAGALEDLAREAAARGGIEIEISRTWRFAGMAWYDLAGAREPEWLQRADAAYREAELHLDADAEPVDSAKLDYCLGRVLLSLADGPDPGVVWEAVERLSRSRATARRAAPELVPTIEGDLANAERVAALLSQVSRFDGQIAALRQALDKGDDAPRDETEPDPKALFGIIQQSFEQEKRKGTMTRERSETLDGIMSDLGRLVAGSGGDRSIGQRAQDRQAIEELMRRMRPLMGPKSEP